MTENVITHIFSHMACKYKCIDNYESEKRLECIVKSKKWINDAKNFIGHVRTHCKLDYNRSISEVIHDGYNQSEKSNEKVLKILFKLSDEDHKEINFQEHMNHILGRLSCRRQFVRDEGKKRNYSFNWSKIAKNHSDVRQIVKWAKEDGQNITVDCQTYLENCRVYRSLDLVKYYLEMADNNGQNIDYGKILDLIENENITEMVKKIAGSRYQPVKYPDTLDVGVLAKNPKAALAMMVVLHFGDEFGSYDPCDWLWDFCDGENEVSIEKAVKTLGGSSDGFRLSFDIDETYKSKYYTRTVVNGKLTYIDKEIKKSFQDVKVYNLQRIRENLA